MGYLPPVFIANKIFSFTVAPMVAKVSSHMLRSAEVGAKALFHVATAPELGQEENGGGLYADTAGAFINCGKPAEECGRVPTHKQPASALDAELAADLWEHTKNSIDQRHLRPLPGHSESMDTSNSVSDSHEPASSTKDVEVKADGSTESVQAHAQDESATEDTQESASGRPPMNVKFSSEANGMQKVEFRADGNMGALFDHYCKQVGMDRNSLHFTIWGQDVDLKKSVYDTWNSLQLDEEDAVDVRAAD